MSSNAVVVTEGLTKQFGQFVALDNLSISLDRGRILGFIGPNGAGKTTTIRILVGLSVPTSGRAMIAGCDCTRDTRQIKRLVGYMPDVFGSYDNMRVREYLDFFGAAYKIPRKERLMRIESVMDTTGSTYMRDRYVETLSHGMKQRVAIARTLLHDPEVLILDEPANGLDPNARIEMRDVLLRLAEMGKTLIVTSHILPELSRICDTVAIITDGKLRAFGTLDEIMQQLNQRRVMEVQVLSEQDLSRMNELLTSSLDPDAEIKVSEQELQIHFSTSEDDARLAEVLAEAVDADIRVVNYNEVMLDLEDAFLSVTQAEAKEPVASTEGS